MVLTFDDGHIGWWLDGSNGLVFGGMLNLHEQPAAIAFDGERILIGDQTGLHHIAVDWPTVRRIACETANVADGFVAETGCPGR